MTFKHFKYVALGACAASALLSTDANAQSQTISGATVSLTIQNAFTLTETTPMHFGTLAMFCDTAAANSTTVQLTTAGAAVIGAVSGAAQIIDIDGTARTQGVFDITGAAPNTALTIAFANPAALTSGCGATTVALSALVDDAAGTGTTDGNGALTINVGSTLTTTASCGAQYCDGAYSGTYDITVSY